MPYETRKEITEAACRAIALAHEYDLRPYIVQVDVPMNGGPPHTVEVLVWLAMPGGISDDREQAIREVAEATVICEMEILDLYLRGL